MKIIYGCYPSIFSLKIANGLVKRGIPITHMMLSTKVICIEGHSIHGLSGLGFLFRRFGLRLSQACLNRGGTYFLKSGRR